MPIHPFWIAAILIIVLIVFGPSRLPELGSAVGKAMREFRKATSELTNQATTAVAPTPEPAPAAKSDGASTPSSETRATSSNN